MIAFSIAFGQSYIDTLFARCLPSLFSRDNFNGVAEPVKLVIYTTAEWIAYAEDKKAAAKRSGLLDAFSEARIICVNGPWKPGCRSADIATWLLQAAVHKTLEDDESFLFAVPDLIFSAGAVEHAYALHKVTGKTVALFNGRVNDHLADADYVDASRHSKRLLRFFLEHSDPMWRHQTVRELGKIAGPAPGHMIHIYDRSCTIFCPAPNPFLGRFEPSDMLTLKRGIRAWDHEWARSHELRNRLIVQTDLRRGFSIEAGPKAFPLSMIFPLAGTLEDQQTFKFDTDRAYYFSGDL